LEIGGETSVADFSKTPEKLPAIFEEARAILA
jgi:hypothetical protein